MSARPQPFTLRGAGGGATSSGGSPSSGPVEAPDSLRSKAVARVLDLVSEGEIVGLVDGYRSVYLDGTPLQNADGSLNFQGVSVAFVPGTQSQGYIAGFPESESEAAVEVEVTHAAPVTRSVANPAANAVRVRLATPALYAVNVQNGAISSNGINFRIEVQSAGGGFVAAVTDAFSGKASSRYERDYRVPLTGPGPWDIRVVKATEDGTSANDQKKLIFAALTTIIDGKLRHPNSAIFGLSFDSTLFSRIPVRSFHLRGLILRVPSNYDPVTRTYSGVWDGTFQLAWSNNPAWCWFELVTNPRFGLGRYVPADLVDKWALYSIGKYCDEQVPDGQGGFEPRFTCNAYLQTLQDAFTLVLNLASTFRAMVYDDGGTLTCVQDAPSDPVQIFTPANILGGYPSYSGSNLDQRHTVALVTWNDPENHYRQAIETVEDPEGIARYGIRPLPLVAFGSTSRGQSHRFGRWALYTERMETDAASWAAGLDAGYLRPGKIVELHDPRRAGKRLGGRLLGATTSALTLDRSITIEAGKIYTVTVMLSDLTLAEATVTDGPGTVSTLNLAPALAQAPQLHAVWLVTVSDLVPQLVRVLRVGEGENGAVTINGLQHDPRKFSAIEQGLVLQPRAISSLASKPVKPTGVTVSEVLYVAQGIVKVLLTATCDNIPGARYLWAWRIDGGNLSPVVETGGPELTLPDAATGRYSLQVASFSLLGTSAPTFFAVDVLGRGTALADVTGLATVFQGGIGRLTWTGIVDVRPFDYEVRLGATAGSGAVLGTTGATEFQMRGNGTYWVAARYLAPDGSAVYSGTWQSVVVAGAQLVANVIATDDEAAAGWTGTVTDAAFVTGGTVILTGSANILASTDILAETDILAGGGIAPTGTYTIATGRRINAGREAYCGVQISYTLAGVNVYDNILDTPDILAAVDVLGDRYGAFVRARPQIRVAPVSGTYGPWQDYVPGQQFGQHFDARVILESFDAQIQPVLSEFVFAVDVPDRFERYVSQAIASGGTTLTFSPAFSGGPGGAGAPLIQGTILNATAGDDLQITSVSLSGATFQVKNAGAGVNRNVNITAEGY